MSSRDSYQSENGAKRGRTETSPNLRPITPGGAKLGDWMNDIQAQIEKLEARCKLNEQEITIHKSRYNSNLAEMNTRLGQIEGRLDKMQDTAKESVDYVNSEIEEVRKIQAKVISF